MPNPVTSAGTKIYIGGTGDIGTESGWVEIGEVTNMPEFGPSYQKGTYNSLGTTDTVKYKGARNAGDTTLQLARIPSDAGQTAVIAARDDLNGLYNFKVTLSDAPGTSGGVPTTMTCKGKVFGYTTNVQDVNSVVKATVDVGFQGAWAEVAAH